MSSLHFGMFTSRGLVNTRAVNFQGFQAAPTTLPDRAAISAHHAREKQIDGGRASGASTSVCKNIHCVNCDQCLEVTENLDWDACRKANIQQEAWPTVNRRGLSRHDCHVVSPPPGFRPGTREHRLGVSNAKNSLEGVYFELATTHSKRPA